MDEPHVMLKLINNLQLWGFNYNIVSVYRHDKIKFLKSDKIVRGGSRKIIERGPVALTSCEVCVAVSSRVVGVDRQATRPGFGGVLNVSEIAKNY